MGDLATETGMKVIVQGLVPTNNAVGVTQQPFKNSYFCFIVLSPYFNGLYSNAEVGWKSVVAGSTQMISA
jgi:hypothetical protein